MIIFLAIRYDLFKRKKQSSGLIHFFKSLDVLYNSFEVARLKKTIVDIAKELNLAPSTISKIVNNKGRISPETRERVLAYVKQEGYVAMSNARILSSKKSWTIGVIYSDISLVGFEHPFFSRILQSFKSYVEKVGYEIVMIVSKLGKNELTYVDWCRNKKVDGVFIVMGNINNPNIKGVVESEYPCVSADIVMPGLTSIMSDDHHGVRLMFDYAQEKNMKNIIAVSGPLTSRSFQYRSETFVDELSIRGLKKEQNMIYYTSGFAFEDGYEIGLKIADLSVKPEIIFVFSDVIAFGVIRALESKGFNVPDDIEVIGTDDIDFTQHFVPALSTIKQDMKAIGEKSAVELLKMIEDNKKNGQVIHKIPMSLIKRQTTKQ